MAVRLIALSIEQSIRVLITTALVGSVTTTMGCRREPRVDDATYRQAVTAFYVSLAAMQTSQDALARTSIEKLLQLVPGEAAGWANLGLLLLRQQQVDEASARLTRASELAPRNASIERLLALAESRKGNLQESVRHWRSSCSNRSPPDQGTSPHSSNSPVWRQNVQTRQLWPERSMRWRKIPRPGPAMRKIV